jgi:hypothetical protein
MARCSARVDRLRATRARRIADANASVLLQAIGGRIRRARPGPALNVPTLASRGAGAKTLTRAKPQGSMTGAAWAQCDTHVPSWSQQPFGQLESPALQHACAASTVCAACESPATPASAFDPCAVWMDEADACWQRRSELDACPTAPGRDFASESAAAGCMPLATRITLSSRRSSKAGICAVCHNGATDGLTRREPAFALTRRRGCIES